MLKEKNVLDFIIIGNTNLNFETKVEDLDGKTFFYQKRYVPKIVRFVDPLPDLKCPYKKNSHKFCPACAHLWTVEQFNRPKVCNISTVHLSRFSL